MRINNIRFCNFSLNLPSCSCAVLTTPAPPAGPNCKPWEKIVKSGCVCKMPAECLLVSSFRTKTKLKSWPSQGVGFKNVLVPDRQWSSAPGSGRGVSGWGSASWGRCAVWGAASPWRPIRTAANRRRKRSLPAATANRGRPAEVKHPITEHPAQ